MTSIDGIIFYKSPLKNKKYRAVFNDKTHVDFGDMRYEQYHDQIGLYSHKDHNDPVRRANYIKRHSKIMNKDGTRAIDNKKSAAYLSLMYLW
jgi:hypothetical protein